MPQSECIKVRLKPGMTDKFVEWAKQVSKRTDEAKRYMNEQGVLAEHIFLERSAEGDFVIVYWNVEDLAKARSAFQASTRKIDLEMMEIVDSTWDRSQVARLEPIFIRKAQPLFCNSCASDVEIIPIEPDDLRSNLEKPHIMPEIDHLRKFL
jgi:hypothetical protein